MRTRDKILFSLMTILAGFFVLSMPIMVLQWREINDLKSVNQACPSTAEEMTKIVTGTTPEMWSRPSFEARSNIRWWRMNTEDASGNAQMVEVTVKWGLIIGLGGDDLHIFEVDDYAFTTPGYISWGCVMLSID
jgi:hypothetical protein